MDQDTKDPPMPSNHTVGRDKNDQPKVRIASSGNHPRDGHNISFTGLNSHEFDLVEGAAHGHQWVTVNEYGRLRAIPTYKELPSPVDDEMMMPFWRPAVTEVETQLEMFDFVKDPKYFSPSISIQHLCGYHYSALNYRREATNLQTWGFQCLRSRRDGAGKFYEIWYLPGTWSAKGSLKEAIDAVAPGDNLENRRIEAAIRFLCHNAMFGTLDVSAQRVALTID